MAENLKLVPPSNLNATGMAAFVQQLNLRLEQLNRQLEQRDKTPKLKTHLDAGYKRLTKVGRALSEDDAIPLGQLEEAIRDILRNQVVTSENDDEGTLGGQDKTSAGKGKDEDDVTDSINALAPDAAPPPVATSSSIGTTTDPLQFSLEDHTHAGYAAVRANSGAELTRRRLNVIPGSGISVALVDDGPGDEAELTITATGGGGGTVFPGDFNITAAAIGFRVDRTIVDGDCLITSVILAQARSLADPDAEQFNVTVYNIASGQFDIGVASLDGPYDFNDGYELHYIIVN